MEEIVQSNLLVLPTNNLTIKFRSASCSVNVQDIGRALPETVRALPANPGELDESTDSTFIKPWEVRS